MSTIGASDDAPRAVPDDAPFDAAADAAIDPPVARIVWRDERFAVVDKPAGVAVHRGWAAGGDDDLPLLQQVRDLIGAYVWLTHRLDRGASGAVLFALDAEAARAAGDAFTTGAVDKRYLAVTRGHPPPALVIDYAIPREPGGERAPAVTALWRRATFGRYALVEAHPRTGRLHQIRRHCKHIACPLIGDVRYGKGEHNRIFRTQHGLHRLALHAAHLGLAHPFGGPPIAVDVPLAADLVRAIASCQAAYAEATMSRVLEGGPGGGVYPDGGRAGDGPPESTDPR